MLPIAIATNYTVPTTLVSTQIPNSNALHVPYDNVEPSVSSPDVGNNTRGNSVAVSTADETTLASDSPSLTSFTSFSADDNSSLSAQTTFFAQLIGQSDGSTLSQPLFGEYEKLVSDSQVKFRPSLAASAPSEQPANLFTQLLQQDTVKAAVQTTQLEQQAAPVVTTVIQPQTTTQVAAATPVAVPAARTSTKAIEVAANDNEVNAPAPEATAQVPVVVRPAISAYTATVHRNNTSNQSFAINEAA